MGRLGSREGAGSPARQCPLLLSPLAERAVVSPSCSEQGWFLNQKIFWLHHKILWLLWKLCPVCELLVQRQACPSPIPHLPNEL